MDFIRDILGHKTYLTSIKELIASGLLNSLGEVNEFNRQLHFFHPMEFTSDRTLTVPLSMKKVNNSIDNLVNRKLNKFSNGGKYALKNLKDQRFNMNCTQEHYEQYYTDKYPDYSIRKKRQRKKRKNGKVEACKPLNFEDYKNGHNAIWNGLYQFLASDREMAWRFIEDDDKYANRVYSIVTGCPKFLRQHFTYDGNRVSILDLRQSGPTFLAKILNSWMLGNDYSKFIMVGRNIYDFLKEKFNKKDRESAKRIFNIWAYGNTDTHYNKRLNMMFPEACEIMNRIKTINKMQFNPTDDSYKNLSCMVYQEESRVFRMIWDELDREIGWFLTCHDEIIVPESKKDHAYQIMHDILSMELGGIPFKIRSE